MADRTKVDEPGLEEVLEFLRDFRGFDFTGYKRSTLQRRVTKRMQTIGIEGFSDYLDYLQVHPGEFTDLFDQILINVTAFFRDDQVWDYLASDIVPRIAKNRGDGPIRVWSAGCASGEEPYGIAMLLAEHLGEPAYLDRVKIYATDVDEDAIATARQGTYDAKVLMPVGEERTPRFFERSGTRYAFRRDLRRALIFGRHDLVQDAPISRTDLILCRNTLMYMNADTQAKVLESFRFSLRADGFLVLGKSEMLFTRVQSFTPVSLRRRVFAKRWRDEDRELPPWPAENAQVDEELATRAPQAAFEDAPVAQLLVGGDGRLILANRRCRELFGVRLTDLGRPLQDLEVSYRPAELRAALENALRNRHATELPDATWRSADGRLLTISIQVRPLVHDEQLTVAAVLFADVTDQQQLQQDLENSNQELETAMEELQSTNEELETTNEELQSTNEELETTNEELQSTNEELETMNEELQSTNEELETVNVELHERTTELASVNAFMTSILSSGESAVVVLDTDLTVQVWNRLCEELWGLRLDEVKGRALLSLDIGLPLEPVNQQIHRCLSGEEDHTTIALQAVTRRGRAVTCRVRCSRLDTEGGGVVLFMDVDPQDR